MKIEYKSPKSKTVFKDLKIGNVFKVQLSLTDYTYMKTNESVDIFQRDKKHY